VPARVYRQILSFYQALTTQLSTPAAEALLVQALLFSPCDANTFWLRLSARSGQADDLLSTLAVGPDWGQQWTAIPPEMLTRLLSALSALSATERLELLSACPEILRQAAIRQPQGVFYTPPALADYLCRATLQVLLKRTLSAAAAERWLDGEPPAQPERWQAHALLQTLWQLRACDPACGNGALLISLFRLLQQLGTVLGHQDSPPIPAGCDPDPLAVAIARWRLWQASGASWAELHRQIVVGNFLAPTSPWHQLEPHFTLWLANPPYLGEKGHREHFEVLHQSALRRFYRARGDLSYYFFHRVLDWSAPQAVAGFITPNYFLSASQAETLREDLRTRAVIHQLIDFHELRLFPGAPGQHTLLSIFERGQNPNALAHLQFCPERGAPTAARLESRLKALTLRSSHQPQVTLYQSPGCRLRQPARLEIVDHTLEGLLERLRELPLRLRDLAQVHQGIVTGADRLTPLHCRRYQLNLAPGRGIFVLTPHESQTLAAHPSLRPWFKNSDIGRWLTRSRPEQWLLYLDRTLQLTAGEPLWEHLLPFQPILAARREVQQGQIAWWQLHWPRQARIFNGPKLVLPQRSPGCLAAWNNIPWYASADVYFITAPDKPECLFALLAWLNGPLAWLWLSCEGKRKGRLRELYHQPLRELPVQLPPPDSPELQALAESLRQAQPPSPDLQRALWQLSFEAVGVAPAEQQALLQAWNRLELNKN
jgi:adenine-specific DNA-methyltransferase